MYCNIKGYRPAECPGLGHLFVHLRAKRSVGNGTFNLQKTKKAVLSDSLSIEIGADEKNRTSTALRQQASETCASTSSATSACWANF